MTVVYAVDACRTPLGKAKGQLATVRPDDLTATVLRALVDRTPSLDPHGLRALDAEPMARYLGTAAAGVHPDYMGIGPVPATHKLLKRIGWSIGDLDVIELNEAFAAQSVAVLDTLDFDPGKVNVNGGAIAVGHPLGCSGARLAGTLVHEFRRRGSGRGLASLCIGVGQGLSMAWERT